MNNIELTRKAIIEKFFDGIFLNILLKIKGIISLPIIVSFFSKADLGLLSLWHSVSALLLGIYLFNIPDSSNRIILNHHKKNKHDAIVDTISSIFTLGFIMYFLVSILISAIYFSFFDNPEFEFIAVLFALIFVKIFIKLAIFVFQIFQQTKLIVKAQVFMEYGTLILVLAYVYFLEFNDIKHIALMFVPVGIVGSLFLINKLRKEYAIKPSINFSRIKEILKISLYLLPSAYAMIILQNTDFLMLRYYWSLVEVGEYSFAYSLSSIVGALSTAVTFFWYSSAVYASKEQLIKMLEKINTYMPILLVAVIVGYYFLTAPIISVINSDYTNVFSTIQILIVGLFCNLNIQILSGALFAQKKENLILISILLGVIANGMLNLLLVPFFGILGGAFSTSISYLLILILQHYFVRKSLINFAKTKSLLYFFTMIVIAIFHITSTFFGNI